MTGNSASVTNDGTLIETERLKLRLLRSSDASDLFEYQSHPDIVRYIPWPERTYDQVIEALDKAIGQSRSRLASSGDFLILGWELKDLTGVKGYEKTCQSPGYRPGKVIGQSNISLRSTDDQLADIGWVTHQDYQRQGLAFEATDALMRYAFDNFPIHRIVADIDTRNPESAAMAEKQGMRREGEFKNSEFFKGAWCSMWLYAILRDELP